MEKDHPTGPFRVVTPPTYRFYVATMVLPPKFDYHGATNNRRRHDMSEQKTEILRAALRAAESKLKEILLGLEAKDLDDQAVSGQLREIERGLRRLARAA